MNLEQLPNWNFAYGKPSGTGEIRQLPEDFIVEETLAFEPSGSGEHVFLQIQKTGENTEFVARQLARFANVRQRDIGYAGLKDRHAVTTQWFSVWLPKGEEPNWQEFETPSIQILQVTRHARKLKRGVLANNCFEITIKNWQGDKIKTLEQLSAMQTHGVPNYYGTQRFGHNGQNVVKAIAMFAGEKVGREQRSLYLSAVRSFLFNEILATRIEKNCWNQGLEGDVLMIDSSHSCFAVQELDDELRARLTQNLLHPTGALFGSGVVRINTKSLELEQQIFEKYPDLTAGLLKFDVESARRALRVRAANLTWEFIDEKTVVLKFNLPAGSYATAVLREIITLVHK
jgi:tRNA pseudouridine13 synthase